MWNTLATRGARIDIKTTSLFRGSLDGDAPADVEPRHAIRGGAQRRHRRHHDRGHDVVRSPSRRGADLRGDGSTTLLGSYGHYSGRYNQVQFSANTSVSNPSEVDYVYSGPAGEGSDFAPGFDIANYRQAVFANFPTANVAMRDGIQSPIVREFTLGVDRTLGQRGM